MTFTLEQLRCFVAVAEELHFGHAAARLGMTQPPLSRQIQKLERVVDAQLLLRDNRRVTLTAAGEVFLVEARRLLSLADAAPDLAEMVTQEQVAALMNEEIDLGLARPPFEHTRFGSMLLYREGMLVAAPTGHPLLALGHDVTAEDVTSEPVVMHSPTRARYFYDLIARTVPIAPENTVHTVSQVLTMLWLVAAGRGIAFVPASAARHSIDGVGFARLATAVAEPVELHLLWLKESANPALRRTLAVLEERVPLA